MRHLTILIAVLVVFAAVSDGYAIPRLQTYITGASYMDRFQGEKKTWVMENNQNFELKVVGGWNGKHPRYDAIDTYLVIGALKGETGTVTVNGVTLTEFDNVAPFRAGKRVFKGAPMKNMNLRFYHLGKIDNDQMNAFEYNGKRGSGKASWGDQFTLNVAIGGFSYVHFDAVGEGLNGKLYKNPEAHDASYYGSTGTAVPEPGTLALLGTGLMSLIPVLRRRRKETD